MLESFLDYTKTNQIITTVQMLDCGFVANANSL
jgi:hypothetical protein